MKKRKNSTADSNGAYRLSVGKLATAFDVPERTLHTILRNAGLESDGGHDPCAAGKAAIAFYRAEAKKSDSEAKRDRDRKGKSEADISEMERGRLMKELCDRDDYRNNYADAIAQGVRNITRLKLPKAIQDKVFAAIRDVKLAEPAEE